MLTRSRSPRPAAVAFALAAAIFLPDRDSEPKLFRPPEQPRDVRIRDLRSSSVDGGKILFNLIPGDKRDPRPFDGCFHSPWYWPETFVFRRPERVRILRECDAILLEELRAVDRRVAAKGEMRLRRSIRTFDEKAMVGAPYSNEILEAAKAHRVDPALIAAVIMAESNFIPSAISSNGARGLMQLMPATARRLGVERTFDPRENIRGGTAYLAELADRFGETAVELILAAYNAGERAVEDFGGVPPYRKTRAYVRRVSTLWQEALAARPASSISEPSVHLLSPRPSPSG